MPKPVEPRTQKAFRHLALEEKAEILHLLDDKVGINESLMFCQVKPHLGLHGSTFVSVISVNWKEIPD